MSYRERMIMLTETANADFLRTVRATQPDKLEWKPLDQGRTVLDMAQECAQSASWFAQMLEDRSCDGFSMDDYPKAQAERATWSLDECERKLTDNTQRLAAAIRAIPDADLDQALTLPWGKTATLYEVISYHYRNVTYHEGQVNYIQTLYGDKEMH